MALKPSVPAQEDGWLRAVHSSGFLPTSWPQAFRRSAEYFTVIVTLTATAIGIRMGRKVFRIGCRGCEKHTYGQDDDNDLLLSVHPGQLLSRPARKHKNDRTEINTACPLQSTNYAVFASHILEVDHRMTLKRPRAARSSGYGVPRPCLLRQQYCSTYHSTPLSCCRTCYRGTSQARKHCTTYLA